MKVDLTNRKTQLSQAYLGHRLNRSELSTLLSEAEGSGDGWEDKFEEMTASRVASDARRADLADLEKLGLVDRFRKMDDDTVWTAEERAIHRHISKLEAPLSRKSAEQVPSNTDFLAVAEQNFDALDRDRNMRLDLSELDFAMSGGFYGQSRELVEVPESAATVAVLRKHLEFLQSAVPHDGAGISRQDLLAVVEAPTDLLAKIKTVVGEDYQEFVSQAHQMVERRPLSQENIDPAVIHQGVIGSCVLLSTLAGLPKEALEKMLVPNEDGSFQVNFADGATERVLEPTVAERLFHAKGEGTDRWPAVLELALAQRLYYEEKPDESALRAAIDGIQPEKALKAMAGIEAKKTSLDELSVNQTRRKLEELVQGRGPVLCGSRPAALGDFISVEELQNGIHNSHCYTVLGFDAKSDTVKLRNPWGKGEWHHQESPDDGVFEMPTRDFYSNFRWVAGQAA